MKLAPVPATILFASAGIAGLLASHLVPLAALTLVLLGACLRAPARRRRPYLYGALATGLGIFVFSPFLAVEGYNFLWQGGPTLPVLGQLGVTSEEIQTAALNGLRLSTLALAFSAYALLVDHDRLVAAAGFAPRSAFAVALATRLVPSLERDAGGLSDAVRGRGVVVSGARGHAKLLSPLVAGSLERAVNLAEAMEARGFGRQSRTHAPGAPWTSWDRVALAGGAFLILAGALWL
jgi:energy-coupling factor transporter transmembrane protein EcfT